MSGPYPRIDNGCLVVTVERWIPIRAIMRVSSRNGRAVIETTTGTVNPLEDEYEFTESEEIKRVVRVVESQTQLEFDFSYGKV